MEDKKDKRVLRVELDDDVKKVSITGKNGDEQVVMRQELSEDDLEQATGGNKTLKDLHFNMVFDQSQIKDSVVRNVVVVPGYGPIKF